MSGLFFQFTIYIKSYIMIVDRYEQTEIEVDRCGERD